MGLFKRNKRLSLEDSSLKRHRQTPKTPKRTWDKDMDKNALPHHHLYDNTENRKSVVLNVSCMQWLFAFGLFFMTFWKTVHGLSYWNCGHVFVHNGKLSSHRTFDVNKRILRMFQDIKCDCTLWALKWSGTQRYLVTPLLKIPLHEAHCSYSLRMRRRLHYPDSLVF